MIASPRAGIASCIERSHGGRAARGVHAAILVYPPAAHGDGFAAGLYERAAAQQAGALERALPRGWRVLSAVRSASVDEAVRAAAALRPRRLVIVSMNPWEQAGGEGGMGLEAGIAAECGSLVEFREDWGDESSLIDLHARCIREAAMRQGLSPRSAVLVLRAKEGCRDRMRRTAALVAARLGWDFSRVRIEMGVEAGGESGQDEAAQGEAELVHDLDIVARMTAGLPDEDPQCVCAEKVLAVLSALVRRGRHPMADALPPLFSWAGHGPELSKHLVMVGVSLPGALGAGEGPALRYCDTEAFCGFKRPHGEVLEMLSSLRGGTFREALVWNTCNRVELYGWLDPGADSAAADAAIAAAAASLLGESAGEANVIHGRRALQHLLRTAAGLNSTLAGDAEVLDQLESARRTAEHAGMAGERTRALLYEAADAVHQARSETPWGEFAHRYCEIALRRLRAQMRGAVKGRCVVIGGSTTGASVLEMLTGQLGALPANMTLIYRGQRSGVLMRRLHGAAAGGRIVNVESYADEAVMDEIVQADAVFLAGDHREPIVCGGELARRRDVAAHPLLVVDFNTLGSTRGLDRLEGVRLIRSEQIDRTVSAFNKEIVSLERFREALRGAERCIARRAGLELAHRGVDAHTDRHLRLLDQQQQLHARRVHNQQEISA